MDAVDFMMTKVVGDKVGDERGAVCVGFTLSKTGSPRRILSSRVI